MTGKQFSGATATQHGSPALPGAVAAVGALKPPAYTLGAATYAEELRFGVVMYGGVSLAVYINGVSHEMFEMACATPLPGVRIGGEEASPTREIYRRLSWLAGNRELVERYAQRLSQRDAAAEQRRAGQAQPDACPTDQRKVEPLPGAPDVWDEPAAKAFERTRFVIDVIAGTSAGGINGVYLAKALVNGEQFGALRGLWIREGDLGKLLNDGESFDSLPWALRARASVDGPRSLLNSDRMFLKLHSALGEMQPLDVQPPAQQTRRSPLVEELDLYITTTDVRGTPVPLRLFDKVIHERRHKQRFHLTYPSIDASGRAEDPRRDFDARHHAFLAYAARCTSSFPFAFEPMTLARVADLLPGETLPGLGRFDRLFDALDSDSVRRGEQLGMPFGDGGYLDNKPFSYVTEALSHRFGDPPTRRKLVYVEPDPEWLDADHDERKALQPDVVTNAVDALFTIPKYETIREDLEAVLARNRRIDEVEGLVHRTEAEIEKETRANRLPFADVELVNGKVPRWRTLSMRTMVRYFGRAVLPYRQLRTHATTNRLATQLAQAWGIDTGDDRFHAVAALVTEWREKAYAELSLSEDLPEGTLDTRAPFNEFLFCFDFDYRVRRLAFLMRRIDRMVRLLRLPEAPDGAGLADSLDSTLTLAMQRHWLATPGAPPRSARLEGFSRPRALDALRLLKKQFRKIYLDMLDWRRRPPTLQPLPVADRAALQALLATLIGEASLADPGSTLASARSEAPSLMGRVGEHIAALARSTDPAQAAARRQLAATRDRVASDIACLRVEEPLPEGAEAPAPNGQDAPAATRPDAWRAPQWLSARVWNLMGQPQLAARPLTEPLRAESGAAAPQGGTSKPGNPAAASPPAARKVAQMIIKRASLGEDGIPAEALNEPEGHCMRLMLGEAFLMFDQFDQTRFTMYYGTDTGEPARVDVLRISPVDAVGLVQETADTEPDRRKLAGTAVAHFGAFLDERWRRNDVLWGRLDGAERLITGLLPPGDASSCRVHHELVRLAQRSILRETLLAQGEDQVRELLFKALQEVEAADLPTRIRVLLGGLLLGPALQRDRLAEMLVGLLSDDGMVEHFRLHRRLDRSPDAQATLRNAARAVRITGKLLGGVSHGAASPSALARWVARLGLAMQGAVAVSMPGTLLERWWSAAMPALYTIEVGVLAVGMLFGSPDLRTAAIGALVATIIVHLITLVLRDQMRGRHRWLWIAGAAAAVAVAGLAGLGAWGLYQQGARGTLCTLAGSSEGVAAGLMQSLCSPKH